MIKLDLLSDNCFKNYDYNSNKISNYNTLSKLKESFNERDLSLYPYKYKNEIFKKDFDLYIKDFYWKFSYKTYLSGGIKNGIPSYDAIKNIITNHKVRGIHFDVYNSDKNTGNEKSYPVIRSDEIHKEFKPLDFYHSLEIVNKYGWATNEPMILYLTFNFIEDPVLYNKIYHAIMEIFSKKIIDKKYSFNGRNNEFPVNKIKMSDAMGKDERGRLILITNRYPTNSKLDEIINGVVSDNVISNISIDRYSEDMYQYSGLSIKYPKQTLIDNNRENRI